MQAWLKLTFSFDYGLFKYRIRPCFIQMDVKTLSKFQYLARIHEVFTNEVISCAILF